MRIRHLVLFSVVYCTRSQSIYDMLIDSLVSQFPTSTTKYHRLMLFHASSKHERGQGQK